MTEERRTLKRGFGSPNYDRNKAKEVQRKGNRVAREKGVLHQWTPAEAREASKKARGTTSTEHPDQPLVAA